MPTPNIPPQVTPTPLPAPQRGNRSTFSQLVDNFVTWLILAVGQFNALSLWVSNIAGDLYASALAAYNSALDAAASAALAQSAAASSVAAVDLVATSSSSVVVGGGDKNFVIQTGKGFVPGMYIRAAVTANPALFVWGWVKTYNPATGALVMTGQQYTSSATYSAWTISISGPIAPNSIYYGSSVTHDLDTELELFGSSNAYQQVSCKTGASLKLSQALGELNAGSNIFTIENVTSPASVISPSSNYLSIKDYDGTLLGFLPPNRTTPAHLVSADTTAGVWDIPGASPAGKPIRYTGTASSRVAGVNGTFLRMIVIDADRVLFLVYGTSLHAIVYDHTNNLWGALTLIRSTWAGSGALDNVMGQLIATDSVLVASCPENTTTAQMVVLSLSYLTITPGTAQTTVFGAACVRLVDFIAVGSTYVLGYLAASNVLRMQARTVSGTTVSAPGTEVVGTTGTAPPALIPVSATVFAALTSTTGTLTVLGYTVSAGTTITSSGAPATATVSTINGIGVKQNLSIAQFLYVTYINTTARVANLSFTGATATLSAGLAVSSLVTTISSLQSQPFDFKMFTAVTGTDSTGGFITEFALVDWNSGGTPALVGSILNKVSPTAQTVGSAGTDWDGVRTNGNVQWMISTSKTNEMHQFIHASNLFLRGVYTYNGPIPASSALPVPAIYPKQSLHKSVLSKFDSLRCCALGDGSKPAVYSYLAQDLQTMPTTPQLINDPLNGARGTTDSSLWLAFSMGANADVIIEEVRFV